MPNNNLLDMTNDIQEFVRKFEDKYGQFVRVTVGVDESKITREKNMLKTIENIVIAGLHFKHPEHEHIKTFRDSTRKIEVQKYQQSFCLIAWNYGYTKLAIAKHIGKNHATIINAIRQAENYLFWQDPVFTNIHLSLFKTVKYNVGTISRDAEGQNNTKSADTSVRDKEQDLNPSD
tara:strand:+ start:480 stop:1007 length:528 start_codon:yes stop_codon:yes gene_type:complete